MSTYKVDGVTPKRSQSRAARLQSRRDAELKRHGPAPERPTLLEAMRAGASRGTGRLRFRVAGDLVPEPREAEATDAPEEVPAPVVIPAPREPLESAELPPYVPPTGRLTKDALIAALRELARHEPQPTYGPLDDEQLWSVIRGSSTVAGARKKIEAANA